MSENKSEDFFKLFLESFSEGELKHLCFFRLNVDYESLPGQGKSDKARELVYYCSRLQTIPQLLELCREERPQIVWPDAADIKIQHTFEEANITNTRKQAIFFSLALLMVLVIIIIFSSGIINVGDNNRFDSPETNITDRSVTNYVEKENNANNSNNISSTIKMSITVGSTSTVQVNTLTPTSPSVVIVPLRTVISQETSTPFVTSDQIEPTESINESMTSFPTLVPTRIETPVPLPIATSTASSTPTVTSIPTAISTPTSTFTPTSTQTTTPSSTPTATLTSTLAQNLGKLLFTSNRDNEEYYQIYLADRDTNEFRQLTNINDGSNRHAVWSPDGQKIAFTSMRNGHDWDIYVMNADGSGIPLRLTYDPNVDNYPVWSPDGSKIAFVSERNGNADIYVVNAFGGVPTPLTNHLAEDLQPDWSVDGKIVFTSSRNDTSGRNCAVELCDHDLYIMTEDGSNQTRLTTLVGTSEKTPDWSPDGQWIAFTVVNLNNGNSDIYRIRSNGQSLQNLTLETHNTQDRKPDWSPDGKYLAYVSASLEGNGDIFILEVSNPNIKIPITFLNDPSAYDNQPYWKPVP